jgi:peroxiredoxin
MLVSLSRTGVALTLSLLIALGSACAGPETVGRPPAATTVVATTTSWPVATAVQEERTTSVVAGTDPTQVPTADQAATTVPATPGSPLAVGNVAPDFSLPDLDGELWSLVAVYADYKDQGLEIVAVSVGEDPVGLKPFVQENGMTFTVLADSLTATMAPYQLRSVPTSYFLDAQGVIRDVYNGAIPEDVLRATVKGMLEQ